MGGGDDRFGSISETELPQSFTAYGGDSFRRREEMALAVGGELLDHRRDAGEVVVRGAEEAEERLFRVARPHGSQAGGGRDNGLHEGIASNEFASEVFSREVESEKAMKCRFVAGNQPSVINALEPEMGLTVRSLKAGIGSDESEDLTTK